MIGISIPRSVYSKVSFCKIGYEMGEFCQECIFDV